MLPSPSGFFNRAVTVREELSSEAVLALRATGGLAEELVPIKTDRHWLSAGLCRVTREGFERIERDLDLCASSSASLEITAVPVRHHRQQVRGFRAGPLDPFTPPGRGSGSSHRIAAPASWKVPVTYMRGTLPGDYTLRIMPHKEGVSAPLVVSQILWQR